MAGNSGWDQISSASGGPGWTDRPAPAPHDPARSRNGMVWALGSLAAVLLVALAGVVSYLLASGGGTSPTAMTAPAPSSEPASEKRTVTVTSTPPVAPSSAETQVATGTGTGTGGAVAGDLGLSVPMARPACDGAGIVVLHSAVTPGAYAQEISSALAQYPGASYLRTDMACPSLRQRDENGNAIYAVYRPSGYSKSELCADVRAAGPPAYGRWLDTTSDPMQLVTC